MPLIVNLPPFILFAQGPIVPPACPTGDFSYGVTLLYPWVTSIILPFLSGTLIPVIVAPKVDKFTLAPFLLVIV